jgi:catalase
MDNPSLARQLVDSIIADFPDHAPGTRPVHTIGIAVSGYFQASDVARSYCIAEHFQGHQVPVTVRFSNGSGSPTQHDGWSDVRGMATRFFLRDNAATDLIAMTLGEFFTPDVDSFLAFTRDSRPVPVRPEGAWQKILDMLRLTPPLPNPMPGQTSGGSAGILNFANRHGFARLAVFDAGVIGAPVSYARATYHAVHTFVVVAPDGTRRCVRFTWQPVAGVRTTDPTAPPVDNYLHQELAERLQRGPAEFSLMMTIGEAGDAVADPTRPWPPHRIRVVMGSLMLEAVAADQAASCEHISFNPCRLVRGIEPSGDPILDARREAYETSREMRGGTACPFNRT